MCFGSSPTTDKKHRCFPWQVDRQRGRSHEFDKLSSIARNALILMRAASAGQALKMTATGNLSRAVVADMRDLFTWPGLEAD
jgi:hypothetical protein